MIYLKNKTERQLKKTVIEDENKEYMESDNESEISVDDDEPYHPFIPKRLEPNLSPPTNILSSAICSSLDRANISNCKGTLVLGSVLSEMGYKRNNVILSTSTTRRTRMKSRKKEAEKIKTAFYTKSQLTIHWDGKLLPSLTGHDTVDRLPVLVSGGGKSQLLGVPCLQSGTGKNQATAICQLIHEWKLKEKISGLCFDTTATNTGSFILMHNNIR